MHPPLICRHDGQPRQTRRERFLRRMEALMPWARLSHGTPPASAGGPPMRLRIHCVQLFYNLSDPAMEDALYDTVVGQWFVGLTARDPRPDETTILNFRHLQHHWARGLAAIAPGGAGPAAAGRHGRRDHPHAPASTKNSLPQARDPEMHQVKKGNQWYFGMKAHIGVDAATGLVHSLATTAANVADITQVPRLLHGAETQVWGDAGYAGVARRPEHRGRRVDWQVALRPGQRRRLAPGSAAAQAERRKASIRAKVEHPFLYVKRHFGYAQVRYRGLAKNRTRLCLLFGFANLLLAARAAPA